MPVSHLDFGNRKIYFLFAMTRKYCDSMDINIQSRWMTPQEVAEYLQFGAKRQESGFQDWKPMAIQTRVDR